MAPRHTRRGFLATAGLAALAGCLGDGATGPPVATDGPRFTETRTARPSSTGSPTPGSGSPPPTAARSLPLPMAPGDLRDAAVSGGPPKDGIPSLDEPRTITVESADDRLDARDVVFGVVLGDAVKAYPQDLLVWHEIVNDVLDGTPIAVTYCPLTGTAQGFLRGETTFGVSGRLVNNNLVMYDRGTETWWPQVLSTAIPGPWNDAYERRSLVEFRVVWTTWARWKRAYPETTALSRITGHARNYGLDPYGSYNPPGGYYTNDRTLFPRLNPDDRYPPKALVMGVRTPDGAAAFVKSTLRERGVLEGALDGRPLLAVYDPVLDTGYAYWNPAGATFRLEGEAVVGPDGTHAPDALPLEPVLTFDAMWFAWSGFYPESTVHG